MLPLALLLSIAVQSPLPATTVVVDAPVHDALAVGTRGEVWLFASGAPGKARRTFALSPNGALRALPSPPKDAVAVDACPLGAGGDEVVYADARGIVDARGRRLLSADALFPVPDPAALYVTPLCGGPDRRELRLPTRDGIAVRSASGEVTKLVYPPASRGYSGRVHRGLLPERPYAMALSLYAPRMYDADVDADGRDDLLVLHEGRLAVFRREASGRLARTPALTLSLHDKLRAPPSADLRVTVGDLDGDGRAELFVGVTEGAVPERSLGYRLASGKGLFDLAPEPLFDRPGLLAPLGVVAREGGRALLLSEVDTSLVALGSVLMTGQVTLRLWLADRGRPPLRASISLTAAADVRQGRMAGALPVSQVDFDGDGRSDLLALGEPGKAALYPGTREGFASAPVAVREVPAFVHVVPLPGLSGVVLVGAPDGRGKTKVALLGGPAAR